MALQYILYFTVALPFVLNVVNTPTHLYNKELTVRSWASQVLILLKMKTCTFLSAMYNASASFANLSLMCGSWRPRPSAAKRLSKGMVYPCGRDENNVQSFKAIVTEIIWSCFVWNHLDYLSKWLTLWPMGRFGGGSRPPSAAPSVKFHITAKEFSVK